MREELEVFTRYLKDKGFKYTPQRRSVLEYFLKIERHLSADELYRVIRKKYPHIGFSTVYRTLKLIKGAGLSSEVDLGDRTTRAEHSYAHRHHDHLICIKCGRFFEVVDNQIELLQERLVKRYKFRPIRHKMEIFGFCKRCQ